MILIELFITTVCLQLRSDEDTVNCCIKVSEMFSDQIKSL